MEPQLISPSPFFLIIFMVVVPALFAVLHINIAINLYKLGQKYKAENDVQFFCMNPILLAFTGLVFGIFAAILSSLVLAVEKR